MANKKPPALRIGSVVQNETIVLSALLRMAIPLILMFGFYIQFHGEVSPGGGFQSGIIFAVAFILRDIVLALDDGKSILSGQSVSVPDDIARIFAAGGVLVYAFTGIACALVGYPLFDYSALGSSQKVGGAIGLTLIEVGVSSTVFGAMILIYNALVHQVLRRFYGAKPNNT